MPLCRQLTKMRAERRTLLGVLLCLAVGRGWAQKPACARAVTEGEVAAGQKFERSFAPGLTFLLEPIASGWIMRVLDDGPRQAHDYAELATPPYGGMTPLAVSTDFSFRSQDAIAWNPRRFRYAANAAQFQQLLALYGPASAGDARVVGRLTALVAQQPEATFTLLDTHLVPGTNDIGRMAATVAQHLAATPHTVEPAAASPLGQVTWMRFRLELELPPGAHAKPGFTEEKILCVAQTTTRHPAASQQRNPVRPVNTVR